MQQQQQQPHSSEPAEELHTLEKVSDELKQMEKTLSLLLSNKMEEVRPGYWSRVAKRVNRVFLIFYITMVGVFLSLIFLKWSSA